jgi:hypothetical protein
MTDPDGPPDEFDRLLATLCDTGLSADSRATLNQWLRSDRALRRRYLLYVGVHATLGRLIAGDVPTEPQGLRGSLSPSDGDRYRQCGPGLAVTARRWRPRIRRAVALTALLAGVIGSAAWWWTRRPAAPRSARPAPVVARISAAAGARFEGFDPRAPVDHPLRAGSYRLVEGIVRVTFARDVEVILTSPAEFVLLSEGRLYLKQGKLSANVPAPARGFTVETPSATLVDLGTEFAAAVDRDGNGEVHVFRGEVIVQPRSQTDSRPLRLTESQATRIDAISATPSGIEADPSRFIRDLREPNSSYSRLIRELGPAAYLPMEPSADGDSLIDAVSPGRPGRVVLGPSPETPWSPGWIGSSLSLRGPGFGDYARIPYIHRSVDNQLSVVAWVLAESRPRWASIIKRWGEPGDRCFHFGLFGDNGDLEVHVAQPDGDESLAREGRPLPTGRWHHVAFVADGTTLHLYRNGEEVATARYSRLDPNALDVAGVGVKLDRTGERPDTYEPGYWHGRLDEIAIFSRALGPDQIRELYRAAPGPDPNNRHSSRKEDLPRKAGGSSVRPAILKASRAPARLLGPINLRDPAPETRGSHENPMPRGGDLVLGRPGLRSLRDRGRLRRRKCRATTAHTLAVRAGQEFVRCLQGGDDETEDESSGRGRPRPEVRKVPGGFATHGLPRLPKGNPAFAD